MSEQEFLRSTPKKLFAIARIHSDINSPKQEEEKTKEVFIDQLL